MLSLLKNAEFSRVSNRIAAGVSDQQSTGVDTVNFQAVLFLVAFETIVATAVTSVKAQHSDDNATWSDIPDSSVPVVPADDNKIVVLEVKTPSKRYVRAAVDRGTANATIDGIFAARLHPRVKPVTQGATVAGSKLLTA